MKNLTIILLSFLILTQSTTMPPKFNDNKLTEEQTGVIGKFLEIVRQTEQTQNKKNAIEDEMIGNTKLHNAIFQHDLEKVKKLLEKHQQHLSHKNKNGNTPLHIAIATIAENQYANKKEKELIINQIINTLIEKIEQQDNNEIIFNSQNKFGITPLHLAVDTKKKEIIYKLLNTNKIKTETADNYGYTPLMIATKHGLTQIVKILANKENVFIKNNYGETSLHLAVQSNSSETFIEILKKAKEKQPEKNILFIKNNLGLIPFQLAQPRCYAYKALEILHNEIFDTLVKSLFKESVDEFIKKLKFIKTGNITNVVEINHFNTILHIAASKGFFEKTKAILENFEIDINCKNSSKNTPLHVAILNQENNATKIIKLLIDNGADINSLNSNGSDALHLAAIISREDVIDLLLQQESISINHKDRNDITTLEAAALNNRIGATKKLIKHGALITKNTFTAAKGNKALIKILKEEQKKQVSTKKTKNEINESEREKNIEDLLNDLKISEKKIKSKKNKKPKQNKGKTKIKTKNKKNLEKETGKGTGKGTGKETIKNKKKLEEEIDRRFDKKFEELSIAKRDLRLREEREKQQEELEYMHKQEKLKKEKLMEEQRQKNEAKKRKRKQNEAATTIQIAARQHLKRKKIDNAIKYIHEINCIKKLNEILFWHSLQTERKYPYKKINTFQEAINFKDDDKNTVLHIFTIYAANYEIQKLIPFLINIEMDINVQNSDGYTPLHLAVTHQNPELVKLLIEKGADINTKEYNLGFSPIHDCVNLHNNKILKFLLNTENIDLNVQANNGFTPLHLAAQGRFGNEQAIKLLLEKEANPRIQDIQGRTADTYSKNYRIINILTGQMKFDPFKDIDPIETIPEFKDPKKLKEFLDFVETDDPIIFDALINYLKINKERLFTEIQKV